MMIAIDELLSVFSRGVTKVISFLKGGTVRYKRVAKKEIPGNGIRPVICLRDFQIGILSLNCAL